MWESRCNFKTQPVNVSRPSAADGRLLNNFDNTVLWVDSLWVYVMSQTRLREGDQEQGNKPKEKAAGAWGGEGRGRPCTLPNTEGRLLPRQGCSLRTLMSTAGPWLKCPPLSLLGPRAPHTTQGQG